MKKEDIADAIEETMNELEEHLESAITVEGIAHGISSDMTDLREGIERTWEGLQELLDKVRSQ